MRSLFAFLTLSLFVLSACAPVEQPATPGPEPTPEPAGPELTTYKDEYISFEYPDNVQILVENHGEGGWKRILEFQVQNPETGLVSATGLSLQFPFDLGASRNYYTFDELRTHYRDLYEQENSQVLKMEEVSVGGRESLLLILNGIGSPERYAYIPVGAELEDVDPESHAYFLRRNGLSPDEEMANQLLQQVLDSLEFVVE